MYPISRADFCHGRPAPPKVMGDRETEFLIDCHQAEPQSKKLGFSK
jgi:hypothetical protein